MKVTDSQAVMLLAVRLDGTAGVREDTCRFCRKPKTEFVASPGLRRRAPRIDERTITCTNARWKGSIPCPGAVSAKPILDALAAL